MRSTLPWVFRDQCEPGTTRHPGSAFFQVTEIPRLKWQCQRHTHTALRKRKGATCRSIKWATRSRLPRVLLHLAGGRDHRRDHPGRAGQRPAGRGAARRQRADRGRRRQQHQEKNVLHTEPGVPLNLGPDVNVSLRRHGSAQVAVFMAPASPGSRGPQMTLPCRMSLTSSGEQPSHSP